MSTTSPYCTQTDLEFMLTRFNLQALLNPKQPGAPAPGALVAQSILWASCRIDFYLRQRYDPLQLAVNDYVRLATALFGAVMMVRLKQVEHAGLAKEYEEIKAQLESIKATQAEVPGAYPYSELGAWHSNVRIDQRYFNRKIRASIETSSNDQNSKKIRTIDPLEVVIEP